jgi:hypothetical protein
LRAFIARVGTHSCIDVSTKNFLRFDNIIESADYRIGRFAIRWLNRAGSNGAHVVFFK